MATAADSCAWQLRRRSAPARPARLRRQRFQRALLSSWQDSSSTHDLSSSGRPVAHGIGHPVGYWEQLPVSLGGNALLLKVFDAKRRRVQVGCRPAEPADALCRVRSSHSLGVLLGPKPQRSRWGPEIRLRWRLTINVLCHSAPRRARCQDPIGITMRIRRLTY
jgi:hypothetical protein